jgi:hypothetical protein
MLPLKQFIRIFSLKKKWWGSTLIPIASILTNERKFFVASNCMTLSSSFLLSVLIVLLLFSSTLIFLSHILQISSCLKPPRWFSSFVF